ncbi:EF-hand domain [Dillenia turbinata]|uniref:EF-hand domain n=1 Tax=Dillenia turbinata TaxID=194707 RepID=A0AAN8VFD0_9MAGN
MVELRLAAVDAAKQKQVEELRDAFANDMGTNHEEVINAIMQDVDTNKDHHISYEEFTAIMKAGINWRKAREQDMSLP